MKLLTAEQIRRLLANGTRNAMAREQGQDDHDCRPVVKLFTPWSSSTWLLTEIDPDDPDIAFGLCDAGFGSPELGTVSLAELAGLTGPGGLKVERDKAFRASHGLAAYAAEASRLRRIAA
jgi:hypothetical protein